MAVVSTAGRCSNENAHVECFEIRLPCIAPRVCVLCERHALGSGKASASPLNGSHAMGSSKASATQLDISHALGSSEASATQLDVSYALGSGKASASQLGSGHALGSGKASASQLGSGHALGSGKASASRSRLIITCLPCRAHLDEVGLLHFYSLRRKDVDFDGGSAGTDDQDLVRSSDSMR
jgi:hypothetical protein